MFTRIFALLRSRIKGWQEAARFTRCEFAGCGAPAAHVLTNPGMEGPLLVCDEHMPAVFKPKPLRSKFTGGAR